MTAAMHDVTAPTLTHACSSQLPARPTPTPPNLLTRDCTVEEASAVPFVWAGWRVCPPRVSRSIHHDADSAAPIIRDAFSCCQGLR